MPSPWWQPPTRLARPRSYFTGSGSCGITIHRSHVVIRGRGAGAGGTLIDCAHRTRHFTVVGSNVTLAGMRLANGSARVGACSGAGPCALADDGGCLLLAGAGARLADCALSGCAAVGRGGAVFVAPGGAAGAGNGGVALEAVHVSGCRATYGGAVWAGAAVSLGAGTSLRSCAAFNGGGVFVQGPGGSLAATWAVIEGCRASNAGGGVHAALNVSIRLAGAATVRGNAAGANGGGVYIVEGGALAMEGDSAVDANTVRIRGFVSRAVCTRVGSAHETQE